MKNNSLLRCTLSMSKGRCTIFSILLMSLSFSQDIPYREQNISLNAGLNIAIGTHFQGVGLVLNAAYVNDHFQANAETRFYYNLKNLGPRKKHGEIITSFGILYGYGKQNTWFNPFYNSVSNQTGYKYAVAYSYNAYWNKIRTSQRTGIVALQFDKVTVINENDLWAPPSLDKFRTAGFLIQFQYDSLFQAAINFSMWTGKMGFQKSITDPHFRFGCYMDTVGSVYPNYSFGLMSGQFKYYLGYGQNAQANIGLDAEQVRNVVQNKIIHDMRFLPKCLIKNKNCHIPMLGDKGEQYLYREDQKIRPAKFYFNVGSNQSLFY